MNDNATVTSYIIERARRNAIVNVFPIGAITKGSAGEELAAIGSMKQAGIVAISDDGRPVMNARVMRRAMEFARSLRPPGDRSLRGSEPERRRRHARRLESVRLGLRGIPRRSEDVMVARDILLAEADRRALSRGAHFLAQLRRDGGVRQAARPDGHRRKPRRTISR